VFSKSKTEAVSFERSNSEPRGSSLFNENQIEETKGPIISEANYFVPNSSKKRTKNFCPKAELLHLNSTQFPSLGKFVCRKV
jgi:hypothetical protein